MYAGIWITSFNEHYFHGRLCNVNFYFILSIATHSFKCGYVSFLFFANFIYCSDFVLVHQASLVRQSTSFLFERVRAMWEESFYRYIFYRRENLIIFVSRKIRMTRYILYIRVVGKLDCLPIFCIEYWYKFTCYFSLM